jgi:mannosyltransferase OCH1-like enzyme
MEELGRPLHRGGLAGLMALEFDLECVDRVQVDRAEGETVEDLKDWLDRRPHSPMPAIRVIDDWCQKRAASQVSQVSQVSQATPRQYGAQIPRQIFQYWSQGEAPSGIETMMDSWRQVKGFDHRSYNRRSAQALLRKMFAPPVARAFGMASGPAEEADLLRLCLLARLGGVWVDADDALYGSLDTVLGQGRGLITYREPLGGAIGNNVLAAPPGHPVILNALQIACAALSRRDNETAWNKTGPGVLTRALGAYLVEADEEGAPKDVTVLDWAPLAREIATNNPVSYKNAPGYWNKAGQRQAGTRFWDHWKQVIAREEA